MGTDSALDLYDTAIQQAFEVELKGRLGEDPKDQKEMKILNSIVRITERGLMYEADPRHVELIAKGLGLEKSKGVSTPATKVWVDEEACDNLVDHEDEVNNLFSLVPRTLSKHKFSETVEIIEIPSAVEHFGMDPRNFVMTGKLGQARIHKLPQGHCPFTGPPKADSHARRRSWKPEVTARTRQLAHVILEGSAWEASPKEILNKLTRKPPQKFVKKRVGAREAKRQELLENTSEVLTDEQATAFRALAALRALAHQLARAAPR